MTLHVGFVVYIPVYSSHLPEFRLALLFFYGDALDPLVDSTPLSIIQVK